VGPPILRSVYALKEARFSEIQRRNEGMSDRVLSPLLAELRRQDLIERRLTDCSRPDIAYVLTRSGRAAIRIVGAFVEFGPHVLAERVYGEPRPWQAT